MKIPSMASWIEMCSYRQTLRTLCFFLLGVCGVMTNIPTYYLDDYCGLTLDMALARVKSGRILLKRPGQSIRFTQCYMFIKSPSNKRINFKFHNFDVQSPYGCHDNNVQIFDSDGTRFQQSVTDKLCNKERIPNEAFISSGDTAIVWLEKESYLEDQIELIFTAFNFSPCLSGDYQCDNSHCISNELYCNGFDNCGDESDMCLLREGTVIGIVVAVVIIAVILTIFLALYMYRRRQRIRREKANSDLYSGVVTLDPYTGEKTMSQISRISREGTLLGKRDRQMKTGYFIEPSGRILQLQPSLLLDGSDLTVKSSRGRVKDRSIYTRGNSQAGALPGVTSDSILRERPARPRSKSTELKPPFFFDKDGYLSDSSASSKRLDNERRDIYAVPGIKVKKSKKSLPMGDSGISYVNSPTWTKHNEVRGTKKSKDTKKKSKDIRVKEAQPDSKEMKPEMIEHRNGSVSNYGHEEMTGTKYIDGSPLVDGTTTLPDIYIMPPGDRIELDKQKDPDKQFIWGVSQSENHVTSPNGILNELQNDANAMTGQQFSMATPKAKYSSLGVPAPRSSIDGKNMHQGHLSPIIKEGETPMSLPRSRTQIHQTERNEMGTRIEDVDQIEKNVFYEPQTNRDLPKLSLDVERDTNYVIDSTGHLVQTPTTAMPMSPTRQMGLEARHQDGSPFILHTARQSDVRHHQREHSESSGDVMDHVISFRSYPSPVPVADPIIFPRRDSRLSPSRTILLNRSDSRYMYSPTPMDRLNLQRGDSR